MEEYFTDRKGVISSNGIGYFLRQPAGRMLMGAGFERAGAVQTSGAMAGGYGRPSPV